MGNAEHDLSGQNMPVGNEAVSPVRDEKMPDKNDRTAKLKPWKRIVAIGAAVVGLLGGGAATVKGFSEVGSSPNLPGISDTRVPDHGQQGGDVENGGDVVPSAPTPGSAEQGGDQVSEPQGAPNGGDQLPSQPTSPNGGDNVPSHP